MRKEFNLHIPISKVDEDQRIVYGYATMEQIDSQGEIVDYEASKRAFKDWIGNIREQHDDKRAVGKAIDIQFDDDKRGVWLGSHISESADGENAWQKIKEGVLTGYSIGGLIHNIVRETVKNNDGMEESVNRIVDYSLGEVSVVDSPALGEYAAFAVVKNKDGKLKTTDVLDDSKPSTAVPWWMGKFADRYDIKNAMTKNSYNKNSEEDMSNVKKSMYTADWLMDLACQLHAYIEGQQYEGNDTTELESALQTIKDAVVAELNEPPKELTIAVELATKAVDLKKGDDMAKEDIKKSEEDVKEEETVEEESTEETTSEDTESEETSEESAADDSEKDSEEDADESEDSEEDEEDAEKSDKAGDLKKATELTKLADAVVDLRKEMTKVADLKKAVDKLEGQVEELSKKAAPAKAKSEYATVEKASEQTDEDKELAKMKKQADAYAADPKLGTPQERADFATKYMVAIRRQGKTN